MCPINGGEIQHDNVEENWCDYGGFVVNWQGYDVINDQQLRKLRRYMANKMSPQNISLLSINDFEVEEKILHSFSDI